jgi:hypothetical protein
VFTCCLAPSSRFVTRDSRSPGPFGRIGCIGHHGVATRKPTTRAALAVALSLLAAATATAPAAAATALVATPDTVTVLAGPEPGVSVPADSRLNDYELTGRVLGVATGTRDARGPAGRGQRLWVFGLNWTTDPVGKSGTVGVTATVNAGTTQVSLPLPARADRPGGGPSGPMWFRASLPAAPTTTVTVTAGQYAQTFDLTTMTRQAPTPAALYRTAGSWETTQAVGVTDQIPTPDPGVEFAPGLATATLPVDLHTVTLSWFAPDTPTDIPTDPAQAWLTVDLSSQVENVGLGSDAYLDYQTPITATGLTLTIPGQPPIPATIYPGGGTDTTGVGIFPDRYAFEVPATLTTATLTVTPGNLVVHGSADSFNPPTTITAKGDAAFPITLPPITTPPVTGTGAGSARHPGNLSAPSTGQPSTATTAPVERRTATGATGPASTSHTARDALLAALALIVLASLLTAIRRHNRSPARTANHRAPTPPVPTPPGPTRPSATRPPPPAAPPRSGATTGPAPRPSFWATPPDPTTSTATTARARATATATTAPTSAVAARPTADPTTARPWTPPMPARLGDGTVEIGVLGPITVTGWPTDPPPRPHLVEILAFLTLHPERAWPAQTLIDRLSPNTPRFKIETVRSYLTQLRTALGDHRVPLAGPDGYRTIGLSTDWDRLHHAAKLSPPEPLGGDDHPAAGDDDPAAIPASDPTGVLTQQVSALALVRGAPFAETDTGTGTGTYAWVDTNNLRSHIERTATDLATHVATTAINQGAADLGIWATDQGLLVIPRSEALLDLKLHAAATDTAHPDRLTVTRAEITRLYAAISEAVPDTLEQTYQSLRPR